MNGIVKWYDDKKGIGFITAKLNGEFTNNILIHYKEFKNMKTLNEGDVIEFTLNNEGRGMSAKNIHLVNEIKKINLSNNGLGSLDDIANMLWVEMTKEIKRHGYSNLTLNLEGAVHGIRDIIKLNNIEE
jgi:cold shock CspA family protein